MFEDCSTTCTGPLPLQRGAVPPLIAMLGQGDVQLREMAAFALGRLAQNADNQAGIVQVRLECADTYQHKRSAPLP